ncbi:peptidoglycan DD-metalloendopeptidase family protein [Mammaliicoccus sp. E-M26]|uniref:peptidoglycan DD-metalloendopeptidase family protein n=1 Tax=Mammaliicoccus sp. E-M26 TaxID=2898686 RepID=UPI001EFBE91B|nr:peptidoglycan DD-metalloendopeptidase family protein [Mammaliicoccus sp. E-M26]
MANNIANLGVQVSMDLDPLKQSTATLKSMLTSNNKALKNHERAFKDSSMGAKDLADREKVLSKQIETSAQYVEKKKEELDNLKTSIGDVNKATDKQKKQLLNANSALSTAQHELSGYRNQLSSVQSKQANMSRSTTDLQSELRDLQLATKMTASEQRKSGDAAGALETEYKGLGRQTQLYNTIIAKEKDKLAELRKTKGDDARETQNQERNVSRLMKEQGSLITQQDKVKSSIDNMNNSTKNTGRGFSDMWAVFKGSFLAQGVMSIITRVTAGLRNMFSGAIERMDAISSNTKSLTLLLGDSTKAAKVMDDALESIEGTSIPLDSVAESVKKLISSGVDAKDLKYTLKGITDSAFGLGRGEESIAGITDALVSMNTAGNANLGDIRRLEDNGVQALKILANQYDMSIEEMKKALSSGELKSSEITKKLIDGIEKGTKGVAGQTKALKGMAQTSAETVGGSFKNFMTGIKASITTILQPVEGDIISLFNNMTKTFKGTAGTFAKTLAPMLKGAVTWFKNLNPNIKTGAAVFTALGIAGTAAAIGVGTLTAVLGAVLSPATLVVGAITAIGTGLVMAYTKSETFRNVVNNVFKSVAGAVQPAIQAVKGFFQLFKGNGQDGVITLSKIFPPNLVVGITNTVNVIKRTVMQVFTAVSTFGQQIGSYLRTFWNQNGTMIMQAVSNIGKAISFVMTKVIWPIMKFIWPAVKYLIVSTWSAIKGTISGALKVITGVIKVFAALFTGNWKALWSGIKQIAKGAMQFLFNAAQLWFVGRIFGVGKLFSKLFGGKLLAMWKSISGFFTKYGSKIWNTTKLFFTRIYNSVKSIFTSTKNFISTTWNLIAKILANTVGRIFKNTTAKFTALSNKVKSTITGLKNGLIDRFTSIKKNLTNLAEGARSAVTGKFKNMHDKATEWIGKIKSFMSSAKDGFKKTALSLGKAAANGAINGLNLMIGGINKISKAITDKNLIKEIKPLHTGTNGPISSPTTAIVNDKGVGNGAGPNGHQELIAKKDGSLHAPVGKNVLVGLEKGDSVINGRHTQDLMKSGIIPKFKKGKNSKNVYEQLKSGVGTGIKKTGETLEDGYHSAKKGVSDAKDYVTEKGAEGFEKVKDGASWLGDKIGDVWDYVKNPKKLVDKMLGGISFGGKKANATMRLAGGAFKKMKKSFIEKVKSMFSEAEGGDGDAGWLLKHKILQYFGRYTGGLMFNGGRHYGIDFAMPTGTPIKALTDGKISQAGWVNGGGGNQVTLDEPGGKFFQWYMHMRNGGVKVKKGQKVKAGDLLGYSGSTGNSTTPHLHIQRMKGRVGNDTAMSDVLSWLKGLGSSGNKAASKWKPEILKAAKRMKVNLTGGELKGIIAQIQRESNGNAGVTQDPRLKDGNSGANLAKGLLQYVPSTFKAYAVKGHNNIKSGYDQLLAFFNNSNWRKDLPYGKSGWGPTGSRRFAKGTNFAPRGLAQVFEKGGEIINFRGGEQVIPNDVSISAIKSVIQSDIFNKTQSAVYNAISEYADALREKEQAKYQAMMQQQVDTQTLQEQNSILKEMLYTMQDLVMSSRNNEKWNAQTANKSNAMDWDRVEGMMSKKQGRRIQNMGYGNGGAFI